MPDAGALKTALVAALGIRGVVHKRREIYLWHNVRIHLDEVAGLGALVEFEAVLAINPAEPIDWSEVAGGGGYFDQAHFGHEFRAFTGLTPTRYVEVRRRFLREHPGHVLDGWSLPAD